MKNVKDKIIITAAVGFTAASTVHMTEKWCACSAPSVYL